MPRVLGVVVGLLLMGLLAFLLWPVPDAARVEPPPEAGVVAPAAQLAATAPAAHAPAADASAPGVTREVAAAPAAAADLARVFGRCVDAGTGEPLAGCVLQLHGWEGNSERVARHGKPVVWTEPAAITTGPDGRFDLRFDPPPPYQFVLQIDSPKHATMSARWDAFAVGEQKDCGDVRMPRGARVTGRVVDSKGVPMAKVSVMLQSGAHDAPELAPRPYTQGQSAADGLFTIPARLAAGEWRVGVGSEARIKSPQTLTIGADQSDVTLQVEVYAADELDVIEGVVLDEREQPAAGVRLDPSSQRGGGQRWICSTDRQGRFRLIREPSDSREPVTFSVHSSRGYESMSDPRAFPWGSKDVVLRVKRALSLEVQALDAETGAPIRAFGVRCIPDPTRGWSSADAELRAQGDHDQGVATVGDVRRGKLRLMVEPSERETYAPSPPIELEMTDGGLPRQVVRVPRWASRVVEVVSADGRPVVGSRVEALVAVDAHTIQVDTAAYPIDRLFQGNAPQAWLAGHAHTDAAGRATLKMVAGAAHVVRAMGPGHVPQLQADVAPADEPLRLTVALGATVVGKLAPLSVVDGLRPAKGGRTDRPHYQPRLVLRRGPVEHPSRSHAPLAIAADGGFLIAGVPPGDWTLHVDFWELDDRGSGGSDSYRVLEIGGLRDGERREVVGDLSRFEKGELRGQVLRDGVALAGARVVPRGAIADGRGSETARWAPPVATDGDGRFVAKVLPGRWGFTVMPSDRPAPGVPLAEQFDVRPGQSTEVLLHYAPAALVVRVLDAQGRPFAQRDVTVVSGEDFHVQTSTDADGRFELDPAPRLPLEFFVWPADLATQAQQAQAAAQSSWQALMARRIQLGSHVIPAGRARDEVTLRLPD